nr:uncharacterized protein LOC120812482 isoform X3 [Gasterosteus aculeatus aculeatus]
MDFDRDQLPVERALGMQWCVQGDTFSFRTAVQERPHTRRGILSVAKVPQTDGEMEQGPPILQSLLEGRFSDQPDTKCEEETSTEGEERNKLAYCVTDVPPWYLCIILGIQHCLTAFGGIIAVPLILSGGLCLQYDGLTQSHLISTIFFVSGICTLLQVTFGVRTTVLIILFSQYLRHIPVPFPTFSKEKRLHTPMSTSFRFSPFFLE